MPQILYESHKIIRSNIINVTGGFNVMNDLLTDKIKLLSYASIVVRYMHHNEERNTMKNIKEEIKNIVHFLSLRCIKSINQSNLAIG